MSVTLTAHACECLDKAPLFIDGDDGKVYHADCDGYIADVESFTGLVDPFWNDQLESRDDAVVIGGCHYRIGSVLYPRKGDGFGGVHFKIKLFGSNKIIDTADLWGQGSIPEEYRGILQDNAKFVRIINVVQYKPCNNTACKQYGSMQNRVTCYACNQELGIESVEVRK